MALLDQLFGQQPQGQDAGGLVQNILSQRFQPTNQDVDQSSFMTGVGRFQTPTEAMAARIAPGMDTATRLAQIQQQGEQTRELQMKNDMMQFQMPFLQGQMKDLYGQGQPAGMMPPVPGNPAPNQSAGAPLGMMPPANQNQSSAPDPRLKKAELAAMMGNKPLSEAIMAEYNADPNVIAKKSEATKTGENNAANTLQADKSGELTNRLEMNLNAMLKLNPDVPSSGFIPAGGHTYMSQATGANPWMGDMGIGDKGVGATAANQWDQINNQQIISEIQQFIASGGANTRINQTLDRIVQAASGIDKSALPQAREKMIKNALAEIRNKNVSSGNLAGGNQPYQQIPVQGGGQAPTQQQPSSGQPQTKTINGQTFINQNGTWYHQ